MAFQSSDGQKNFNSKFRQSRYNRENSNPNPGPKAQSTAQADSSESGSSDSAPDVDSRLHNNPHPEKFNTPLNGPKPSADGQEMGEGQKDMHDEHSVTCPECGASVPVTGDTSHSDAPAGQSETEKQVENGDVAKGVWKPGQREHPDAENAPKHHLDDFEPTIL